MNAKNYTAIVEVDVAATGVHVEEVGPWMDRIRPWHGAIWSSSRQRFQLALTLPATNLQEASAHAMSIAEQTTGAAILSINVLPTSDWDVEVAAQKPIPDLMTVAGAADQSGLTPKKIRTYVKDGRIPHLTVDGETTVLLAESVRRMAAHARRHPAVRRSAGASSS